MSKFCGQCGVSALSSQKFCESCGYTFNTAVPSPISTPNTSLPSTPTSITTTTALIAAPSNTTRKSNRSGIQYCTKCHVPRKGHTSCTPETKCLSLQQCGIVRYHKEEARRLNITDKDIENMQPIALDATLHAPADIRSQLIKKTAIEKEVEKMEMKRKNEEHVEALADFYQQRFASTLEQNPTGRFFAIKIASTTLTQILSLNRAKKKAKLNPQTTPFETPAPGAYLFDYAIPTLTLQPENQVQEIDNSNSNESPTQSGTDEDLEREILQEMQ